MGAIKRGKKNKGGAAAAFCKQNASVCSNNKNARAFGENDRASGLPESIPPAWPSAGFLDCFRKISKWLSGQTTDHVFPIDNDLANVFSAEGFNTWFPASTFSQNGAQATAHRSCAPVPRLASPSAQISAKFQLYPSSRTGRA